MVIGEPHLVHETVVLHGQVGTLWPGQGPAPEAVDGDGRLAEPGLCRYLWSDLTVNIYITLSRDNEGILEVREKLWNLLGQLLNSIIQPNTCQNDLSKRRACRSNPNRASSFKIAAFYVDMFFFRVKSKQS